MELEISTDRARLDVDFIHDYLSRESYWARGRSREAVERTVEHSLCFGAYEGGRQIAFARVVTDYAIFGYLADVFVAPASRGRGVSKLLMRAILDDPRIMRLPQLLLRTRDAQGLYAQFGFQPVEDPSTVMMRLRILVPAFVNRRQVVELCMPISEYLLQLRAHVGTALLLVPSVTGLVFDSERRVLLVRHAHGNLWGPPGGAIDAGETPPDAVVRELWEETGLHVEPLRLRGVFGGSDFRVRYSNGDRVEYVSTIFECRAIGGSLRADLEEVMEARFVASSERTTLELAPWLRRAPPSIFEPGGPVWIPEVTWRAPPG